MYLNEADSDDVVTLLPSTKQTKLPLITDEERDILLGVGCVGLSSAICLFGMVSNIMNIIVFHKQGFKNTANISFLGLAISDFFTALCLQWCCICVNPLLYKSDIPFYSLEFQFVTGAVPHTLFNRITSCITAFVERCLGVLFPLKVKRIITPRVTILVLSAIYVVNIMSGVPELIVVQLDWKFYDHRNKTLLGAVFIEGHPMARLSYILSPVLAGVTMATVITFTIILVIKLKQKSKWRSSVTSDREQAGTLSTRDKSTVRIVIVIASVLIMCNIPGIIVFFAMIFEPEFRMMGVYHRIFMGVWAFPLMFQAINSSLNIFFYYNMSTNYRVVFQQLVLGRRCGKGGGIT